MPACERASQTQCQHATLKQPVDEGNVHVTHQRIIPVGRRQPLLRHSLSKRVLAQQQGLLEAHEAITIWSFKLRREVAAPCNFWKRDQVWARKPLAQHAPRFTRRVVRAAPEGLPRVTIRPKGAG